MRPSLGRSRRVFLAAAVVAILATTALPVEASAHPTAMRRFAVTSGLVTDQRMVPSNAHVAPIPGAGVVHLEISLTPRDPLGLAALDQAVVDPSSPQYHHFLTEPEFEARFDPASPSVTSVEAYFAEYGGGNFQATPDHLGLRLEIPTAGADAALSVHYDEIQPVGAPSFVTAVGTPQLPSPVAALVEGIGGLSNFGPASLQHELRPISEGAFRTAGLPHQIVVNASTGGWWFTGSDYVQGYRENDLMPTSPSPTVKNTTFAGDEAVATILMSGFNNTSQVNLPPFDPTVVQSYYNDTFPNATGAGYNWSDPSLAGFPVELDGTGAPPPGGYGVLQDDSENEAENSLDLEMAGSFAPGASLNSFYFAYGLFSNASSSTSDLQNIADDFATCLSTALSHNYDGSQLVAVTNSYGLPDLNDSLWDSELQHAAAIGVTVVASSGDQGDAPVAQTHAFQGQNVSWPASAAFNDSGTLAVGGVSINLTGTPTGSYNGNTLVDGFDASVGGISALSAWYNTEGGPGQVSGSEGGISPLIAEPYWQRHSAAQPAIVNVTLTQGAKALGRAEPDISFPANATLIYVAANASEIFFETVQGTSVAAPIFAGFLAETAAVSGERFGYLDPELYRMGSYYAEHAGAPGNPILDVTNGGNALFPALPGWDGVTGWGTLDPVLFLSAIANTTVNTYQYSGPSPGLPITIAPTPSFLQQHAEVLALIALGGALVFAILAVVVGTRPKPRSPYSYVPPGVYAPTPGGPPPPFGAAPYGTPPATFLCPYCGSVRPAEPVRCPACGAF